MSEQGWHDFRSAEGVDDWVLLHGGATAVVRVDSLDHAMRVAAAQWPLSDRAGNRVCVCGWPDGHGA